MGKFKIRHIDRNERFWKNVPEIKILVEKENARLAVFRCSNGGGIGSCSLCIRWQICEIRRTIQEMGRNLRVLECFYFRSEGGGWLNPGADTTEIQEEILSFSKLVRKVLASERTNPLSWMNTWCNSRT